MHGISDDASRVTSEAVFAAMGMTAASGLMTAQQQLDANQLIFISVNVFCPPLATQLSLRWRMGVRNSAHTLAKPLSPFADTVVTAAFQCVTL